MDFLEYTWGGAVIPSIGMLISLCAVFQKKHRRCAYLNIVAFFIVRIVVTQARSETLILIALILIGILNVYKPLRYVRSLIYLILGMAILGILILGDIQLAQSSLYNRDYSIMVRFDGINFFWKKFLEYPIFGMGFLSLTSDKNSVAYTLLSNVRGYRYHRSDVGIFGLLNTFGIVGAIWYVCNLKNILKKGKAIYRRSKDIFGIITFWWLLLTTANLIITDFQRIGLLPIIFLIINKKYEFCIREQE